MKFWLTLIIIVVALVLIVPVIMATAWKIAGWIMIALVLVVIWCVVKMRNKMVR